MTDEEILDFWTKNSHMKFRFDAYIQLKMILSPVIEYVILLDRLIYLHEVEKEMQTPDSKVTTMNEHYLIKIFDPTISPRCHAMVSFVK